MSGSADSGDPAPLDGRLAVVMITRNRRADTLRALAEHLRLPERPRLIVVDNGSSDGTTAAVRRAFPAVEVVRLARNRGASARNVGVRLAGTPYVAFSDDDSWWDPGALAGAAETLDSHPSVAAVTARSLVGEAATDDPVNAALDASPLPARDSLPGPRVLGFIACATAVRAEAFLEAGGFDERFAVGGEEELLACDLARAGWDIVYRRELVVHHHPSAMRSAEVRRRTATRNTLRMLWLRRPLGSVARRMLELARTLPRDRVTARALVDLAREAPSIARDREVVPPSVERELRLLERADAQEALAHQPA